MPTSSAAINIYFLGVIDPKPNLNGENECFLDKEIILRVLSTKPIGLVSMTHHKFIKFAKKFFMKGLQINKFYRKVFRKITTLSWVVQSSTDL